MPVLTSQIKRLLSLFILAFMVLPVTSTYAEDTDTSSPPPGKYSKDPFSDPYADDPFSGSENQPDGKITLADPLEPINRPVYRFNKFYYFKVLKPANMGWEEITSSGTRSSIRNFYQNLKEPVNIVNAMLQWRWYDARESSYRFLLNSTFGGAGFFDVAQKYHPRIEHSFDQTLARWGASPGFYIHWPFIGPSSPRGTVGFVAEEAMNPINYHDNVWVTTSYGVVYNVNEYSYKGKKLEEVMKYSVDGYSALKNIYEQQLYNQLKKDSSTDTKI
ncbi:MAG: VacJ family lipoprotein [bacterium]